MRNCLTEVVVLICGFLLQEYLVPEEYVQTMRASMLNKCPVSSYDQVCEVFKKELGGMPDQVHTPFICYWKNCPFRIVLLHE